MVIYPVPPAVTQARVQLSIDETAKAQAAPTTIIQDLGKVIEAQKEAEQALLIDLKA